LHEFINTFCSFSGVMWLLYCSTPSPSLPPLQISHFQQAYSLIQPFCESMKCILSSFFTYLVFSRSSGMLLNGIYWLVRLPPAVHHHCPTTLWSEARVMESLLQTRVTHCVLAHHHLPDNYYGICKAQVWDKRLHSHHLDSAKTCWCQHWPSQRIHGRRFHGLSQVSPLPSHQTIAHQRLHSHTHPCQPIHPRLSDKRGGPCRFWSNLPTTKSCQFYLRLSKTAVSCNL